MPLGKNGNDDANLVKVTIFHRINSFKTRLPVKMRGEFVFSISESDEI
jgi:hypothetical protein